MNVVLVRQGTKFPPEYVSSLAKQLRGHDVFTLTDQEDTPGEVIPLRHGLEGWWAKMELFAPDFDYRPCFFLDLDTIVRGDISDMLEDTGDLWLIRDFYQKHRRNSGLMKIPKNVDHIWNRFQKGTDLKGDGDFLNTFRHKVLQDAHDGIVSYKVHCRSVPRGRIVCFHGKPKPHECDGWVAKVWNSSP